MMDEATESSEMTNTKPFPALSNFDDATLLSELRRRGFAVIIGKYQGDSMRAQVVQVVPLIEKLTEEIHCAIKCRKENKAGSPNYYWYDGYRAGFKRSREIVKELSTDILDS